MTEYNAAQIAREQQAAHWHLTVLAHFGFEAMIWQTEAAQYRRLLDHLNAEYGQLPSGATVRSLGLEGTNDE